MFTLTLVGYISTSIGLTSLLYDQPPPQTQIKQDRYSIYKENTQHGESNQQEWIYLFIIESR